MARSTFKVLFFLKRDKQKANGLIPLFCRITVDGQEVRFGMKCDVNPKFWDVKAGKASGRTTEATKINSLIENTKAAIFKIYRDLQERDNYVTAETVRNVFLGATVKQQTLLQLCDKHNRERKPLIGVSICAWNYGSYCRMRNHLADFLHRWYSVSDIPIRDVDQKFIRNFEAYLTENYRYAHNTLTHYLQNLRHIIHLAIDAEYITKNPFANFPLQVKCPDRAFLTQDEVEKMIATHIDNEKIESSHLARHTFATTIALTKGVPIETVSKMLGHTSIKTTQIYAKVINSKISNDMDMLAEKLSGMETKFTHNN
jgi:hypothetical protein